MNNTTFQAIRAVVVLGIALFAFASEALAAPMLTPVTVTRITGNSATIIGHVSNPQKNSTVWFELDNTGGAPTTVAMQGIWGEGTFEWNLRDLNPGQTYSYRAWATEGGVTISSPTSSFTTTIPKSVTSTTISNQSNSSVATKGSAPKTVQTVATKQATTTPVSGKEGFTNGNSASVIGAGNGMFPSTLIGWIALIISILVMILVAHMIYEAPEERRKKRAEENPVEEDEENK
ncbi:MAG: hypothetical protein AAB770_01185 [Patescibacteria group bacterium]